MNIFKKIIILMIIMVLCPINILAQEIKAPDVKALGAVLIDGESGRVLWQKNADKPLANASTTKIMTCLIAIESGKLDETVTVSKKSALQPKTKMGLTEGEKIKLKDLLYSLMLQSSNDAAVAIAEHVGGSVEKFCTLMNERAYEIGAKDTYFETPNGLDSGNHHSTAYDMAIIASYALKNEEFLSIINTKNITVKSDRCTYDIVNKNRLLNEYNGAIGVKTGFTGKAGHCFVGAAQRDGMRLVSAVLGSGWGNTGKERKWIDTKNILNYGFNYYDYYDLCVKGDYINTLPVEKSYRGAVRAEIAESISIPLNATERESLFAEIKMPKTIEAPVNKGDELGKIVFKTDNDTVIAQASIIAQNSVNKKDIITTIGMLIKYWINPQLSFILKR